MELNTAEVQALVSEIMNKMKAGAVPAKTTTGGQEAVGAGGNEPFDLDYGMMDTSGKTFGTPYPRISKILKRVHATTKYVDAERAVLATKAYQMYEADPPIIKQAKVLAYVMKNCTIRIQPDELIVGEIAAPSRSTPIFPEFSYDWITDELRKGVWSKRNNDVFEITDKDKEALFSIEEYWKGRTVSDAVINMLSDEQAKGSSLGPKPVFFPNLHLWGGVGHIIPRFQKLLKTGWIGLKNEIIDCFNKLDTSTAEGIEKREFYVAQFVVLDALKEYSLRWAQLAREEAAKSDPSRKAELLVIGDNMEWLSENPPRNFYEAIQFYCMIVNCIHLESNGQGISWGRPDQHLYPFYKKDMEEGKITKWFVGELWEQMYIKIFEQMRLRDDQTSALNSELGIGGPLLLLGGCDQNGVDITNDLTYIGLEAHAHTQLPDPWLSVRWSSSSPWEYKVKVVNTVKVGTSQPKIFNDECIIPNCLRAGRSLEDARNYSVVGCVEIDSGGREYGEHDAAYFNMAKVLELACNHGRCVDCSTGCPRYAKCSGAGQSLGPDYGGLDTYKSFDEVKDAFYKEMDYWVTHMCAVVVACDIAHARNKPLPYASLLIEDCIQNGKDLTQGGAHYNFSGPQGIAVGTCADSFATIKQLIFEEKKITGSQLLDALKANWKGHEQLLALVNSEHVHHFGNDDDYADDLARFTCDAYCDAVDKHKNYRGGIFHPGIYSVSANVGIGMTQAATPDGRGNYEALSNCMGPVQTAAGGCHDVKGPTAVIRSAAKCDHIRAGNGTLLNIRFSPSCVSGDTGRDNFIAYIEDYFARKGLHVQFNIVNTETLRDAQKHPENYPTLLVRVAGYSAYFTKLSKELQDDLIGRNSYDSFD
jgi:formate C-acetyltransferase